MKKVWKSNSTILKQYNFELTLSSGMTMVLPTIEALDKQNAIEALMAYKNLEDLDVVEIKIK